MDKDIIEQLTWRQDIGKQLKRKQLIQLTHSRFYNVRVLEGSTVSVRHVEQTIEGVNSILHCTLFFILFAFQDDDSLPTQAPISSTLNPLLTGHLYYGHAYLPGGVIQTPFVYSYRSRISRRSLPIADFHVDFVTRAEMERPAVGSKRKRSVLTLEKKLEILKKLEKGLSQRVVGEKFGVAKSTVADIWKDRQKIINAISSSELWKQCQRGQFRRGRCC